MKNETKTPLSIAVLQQVTNNATSWIGRRTKENEGIVSGQTFIASTEGDLDTIHIFSSIVTRPGKVTMTFYNFNQYEKSWGAVLGSASLDFNHNETGKWIAFNFTGLHLHKGQAYGFRLESSDTYVGLGEATGTYKIPPFVSGQVWKFSNINKLGNSYSYFSLAFKVNLRA